MSYQCSVCGELHEDLPDLGADRPIWWWNVPEEERDQRIELTTDTCVIDNEFFYIRGLIEVPLQGRSDRFGFGVWVSLQRENFTTYMENFESNEIGPFFGWLSTVLDYYSVATLNLKTRAHFRGGGLRPLVELEPTDHPLALDQRNGITLERVWEIVHYYLKADQ